MVASASSPLLCPLVSHVIPYMGTHEVILDTDEIVSALRSRRGASYRLLELLDDGKFGIALSVPLALEYEQVAGALIARGALRAQDIADVLDYPCAVARHCKVFYLWRPFLRDPRDDM